MRACVPFWVEANSLDDWVCVDAFRFDWKQIRLLIEIEEFVTFRVEANSFADWVSGDAFPFKLIQFRFLIEYVGMC